MDAARFEIQIEANSLGVDASASQLNALADRITKVSAVSTAFDKSVAASRSRLEEASAAAKVAAAALQTAEARYKELEGAANKAAKALELAKIDGDELYHFQDAVDAANAAMRDQAAVVDSLRAKSDAAAAAQTRLAGSLKTLEQQQAASAAAVKQREAADAKIREQSYAAMAAADQKRQADAAQSLARRTAALKMAAAAGAVFVAATLAGAAALTKFAIESNPAAMMRLAAASQRFTLGMKSLVSGLKFDKFLDALDDIGTLFQKGTSSANGMKVLVETLLQPLIDAAAKAGPYVKEMFKGLIYGALQVVIAVLKIRNEIFKAMSPETRNAIKSAIDQVGTLESAFKLGQVVAVALVAAAVVLTAALIALGVAELFALWPILLIVAAVAAVIAILMNWGAITTWLKEQWDGFVAFIKRIPEAWVNAAKAMIDGLVKGIKDGAAAVWKAMSDLAGGAIDAFKSKLGIKSPSAVMRLQASYTTQGFVEGIDDGLGEVESAGASMGDAAVTGAAANDNAASGGRSGSGNVINFNGPITFGSENARAAFEDFKRMLAEALGGSLIVIGGGEAPAT